MFITNNIITNNIMVFIDKPTKKKKNLRIFVVFKDEPVCNYFHEVYNNYCDVIFINIYLCSEKSNCVIHLNKKFLFVLSTMYVRILSPKHCYYYLLLIGDFILLIVHCITINYYHYHKMKSGHWWHFIYSSGFY